MSVSLFLLLLRSNQEVNQGLWIWLHKGERDKINAHNVMCNAIKMYARNVVYWKYI